MKITAAKTILVTFLMQMGDLILTTPFLAALRKAAPQAKITYLIDEKWRGLMEYCQDIDELLTVDRKGRDDSLSALWRKAAYLRGRRFDLCINLNPSERCAFLAAFSGAQYKIGAAPALFKPFFDRPLSLNRQLHAADMYLDVLRRLAALPAGDWRLKLTVGPEAAEAADDFWAGHGIGPGDKVAGFNIGSASASKRWPPGRFAQVADALAQKGYKTVFFGSAAELPDVRAAAGLMAGTPVIATGCFTVAALTAAIRRVNIFITNDSGPLHIAVSQGVPTVGVYGPSKPELYGPYKPSGAAVVQAEPRCYGCKERMKHNCPDLICMNNITAGQVTAAAHTLTGDIHL